MIVVGCFSVIRIVKPNVTEGVMVTLETFWVTFKGLYDQFEWSMFQTAIETLLLKLEKTPQTVTFNV